MRAGKNSNILGENLAVDLEGANLGQKTDENGHDDRFFDQGSIPITGGPPKPRTEFPNRLAVVLRNSFLD